MKKTVLTLMALSAVMAAIFLMCRFRDGNMPEPGKSRQSVLEDFGSEEKEIGFELIDETETYPEEEKERLVSDVQELLNGFTGEIFAFGSDTGDFTEQLLSKCVSGEEFGDAPLVPVRNIYEEFQKSGMESKFHSYQMSSLLIRKDKEIPEISVTGYVSASFQNHRAEQGDYAVGASFVLLQCGGQWKIYAAKIDNVYKEEGFSVTNAPDYGEGTVKMKGKRVMAFDFWDTEGFLTGYTYGSGGEDDKAEVHEVEKESKLM